MWPSEDSASSFFVSNHTWVPADSHHHTSAHWSKQAAIEINVYLHVIEHVSFIQLSTMCWTWRLQFQRRSVSYPQAIYIFRAKRQERKLYPLIPACLQYGLYKHLQWVSYPETIKIWETVHFLTCVLCTPYMPKVELTFREETKTEELKVFITSHFTICLQDWISGYTRRKSKGSLYNLLKYADQAHFTQVPSSKNK